MSLKILLVDSESERARSLEQTLACAGFSNVARVGGGADLVEAVRRLAPDLVIFDMALPVAQHLMRLCFTLCGNVSPVGASFWREATQHSRDHT